MCRVTHSELFVRIATAFAARNRSTSARTSVSGAIAARRASSHSVRLTGYPIRSPKAWR